MKKTILLTILICACSTEPEGHMSRLPVTEISAVSIQNKAVTLKVNVTVPEAGCWQYHHYDWYGKDFEYTFTIVGQRTTTDPCLQVLGSIDPTINYTVPSNGTYTFHFWTSDTTTISTTITVP